MRKVLPILVLFLVITGYFAYSQHKVNEDLVRRVESQYQRSFHELVWNVETINSQLAQTLISSSSEQVMLSLTNLWRESFAASSNLGGLPIAMVELDKTDKLINDIANYSYYILKANNLEKQKLTEKEWEKIRDLYERSKTLRNELQSMEAAVLDRNLSFVEVETVVLRRGKDLPDNSIVDGFTTIENKIKAFPDLQFDEGVHKIEPEPRPIAGESISEQKAVEIAKKFINAYDGPVTRAKMSFSAEGRIPIFGVEAFKEGEDTPTYIEVTKKGGKVIQIYTERAIREANLDLNTAEEHARKFLKEQGLTNLDLVDVTTGTFTAIFTFVPTEKGVRLYSDMIKTQVALDTGQIISFDQTSYLSHHHQRSIETPKISEDQITDNMNPNFEVQQVSLAYVPSEFRENHEVLCYEVRGKIEEERFILFINAETGEDFRIVRLTKPREFEVTLR
ncbi:MAG: germination protein YpeB [Peptococcales bacterium]